MGLGVGGTIGSGIFVVPAVAAGIAGPASLIAWALCAVSFGAVLGCLTLLARKYAVTGAFYTIFDRSFSAPVAAATIAIYIVSGVFGVATIAAALGDTVHLSGLRLAAFEAGLVIAFGLLNLIGIALSAKIEDALTVLKLLPLLVIPLLLLPHVDPAHFAPLDLHGLDFLKSAVIIYWCYTGFELSAIPARAVRDPERNVPRSLIYVFVAVTAIYLSLNFALIGSVGADRLAASLTPVADAVGQFFDGWGIVVTAVAIVSMLSALNAYLLGTSLVLENLSERYWKPLTFERKGIPVFTVIICTAATVVLLLFSAGFADSFRILASLSVIATLVPYLLLCYAVLKHLERPLYKIMAIVGILSTGLVLLSSFISF